MPLIAGRTVGTELSPNRRRIAIRKVHAHATGERKRDAMGERFNFEDQVGGLIDHHERPARRRVVRGATAAEPLEPERYRLTARAKPRIRAHARSDELAGRRVA